MKRFYQYLPHLLILALTFLIPILACAQDEATVDTLDAPIDGGITFLIAAAIGAGAKKAYHLKKKEQLG